MHKATFTKSEDGKVLTVERQFDAPVSKVWEAHTKQELLEAWWAPKPWQAGTKSFDFREGGSWIYYMSGPEGEKHYAGMTYHDIEPEKRFSGDDYFCDEEGNKNTDLPVTLWKTEFFEEGNGTKLVSTITFASAEDLEKMVAMGMQEGYGMGLDQLDALLSA